MRRPNRNASGKSGIRLFFTRDDFSELKWNEDDTGGYQSFENWLIVQIEQAEPSHPDRFAVFLPDPRFGRLMRYVSSKYGSGGPNNRLRRACERPLTEIGIWIGARP